MRETKTTVDKAPDKAPEAASAEKPISAGINLEASRARLERLPESSLHSAVLANLNGGAYTRAVDLEQDLLVLEDAARAHAAAEAVEAAEAARKAASSR